MAFILRWVPLPDLGIVRVAEIPTGEYGGSIIIDLFSYLYNTGANINFLIHRLSWIATLACFKWRNHQIDRSYENILSRPVTERTWILSIYAHWVHSTTADKSKESYRHVCQAFLTQGTLLSLSTMPLMKIKYYRRSFLLALINFALSFSSYGISMWLPSVFAQIEKDPEASFCQSVMAESTTNDALCGSHDAGNRKQYLDSLYMALIQLPGEWLNRNSYFYQRNSS